MTNKMIHVLYGEAVNYTDPDAFASDSAMSVLNPEDPEQEIDLAVFNQLRVLWHVANDPFKDFLRMLGIKQSECAIRFCIPLRTVQSWALRERDCPRYIRIMMAELTGILKLREDVS